MPAFMAESTIGRALESIAHQTTIPVEVIVVDDGSDDATVDAAKTMEHLMPGINLTVIRQNHKGAGAARNRALKEAGSDYVAFLDADDEWLPKKLERSVAELERTNSVLVSHDYVLRREDGTESVVPDCSRNFSKPGDPYVHLYRQGYIATSAVVARRDAVMAAGGFDENLLTAQDFALWLTMLSRPETPFCIFPGALLRAHRSSSGITSHTERRLACTLEIAQRFLPALAERPGLSLISLWYRVAAVHYEALNTYLERKHFWSALGVFLRFPVNFIKLTVFNNSYDK
jgi:teichuronic acid biosynthesis glycosyltransferase TuaG